jgi:tetratricopeptide (TPR) repeat protein
MKWKLVLLWLLITLAARAQPGGGGGLDIGSIYGREAGRLVQLDSATVQVRQFVLSDAAVLAAYRAGRPYRPLWYPVVYSAASAYPYPISPPRRRRSSFDLYHAAVRQEVPVVWHPERYRGSNVLLRLPSPEPQRLLLVYRTDTMVLDLSNLPHENGGGRRAQLGRLVVMPGYFGLSFEQRPAPGQEVIDLADKLHDWPHQHGFSLTPGRVTGLRVTRYLTYRRAGPDPRQLPDPAVLRTWLAALQLTYQARWQPALTTITRAQAAGVALNDARTCLLLANCYLALRQPRAAEQQLTQALRLTPSPAYQHPDARSDLEVLRTAYEQRMSLHLRARRYPQALADYDSLGALRVAELRYNPPGNLDDLLQSARAARLAFLTDSLHDASSYRPTMQQLRADLEPTLTTMWRCRLDVVDAGQLNQLATAEYHCGERAAAYQHWQLLLIRGGGRPDYHVDYFTRLLTQHPNQPDLLLCRALARLDFSSSYFPHPQPARAAALRDLQLAARLRPRDFRPHYFRARLHELEGKLALAVNELNQAIAKEPNLPALYRFRFDVRVEQKQVTWYDSTDPDYARYSELCADGR